MQPLELTKQSDPLLQSIKRNKLLLVNPWIHDFSAYDLWAKPLGLLVLADYLRRTGWQTTLVDCLDPCHTGLPDKYQRSAARGRFHRTQIPKPECLKNVPRTYARYGVPYELIANDLSKIERPDAILVTSLMTYWRTGLIETIDLLRNVFPGVPILLGGIYASIMGQNARKLTGVDKLIVGPAEQSINRILGELLSVNHADQQYSGLNFTPALDLMSHVSFIPLLTSRGCPYKCHYCASKIVAPSFVQRPVNDVIKELQTNLDKYGCKDIAIYDDAFLVNPQEHALKILEPFESDRPELDWHCPNGLHARAIDKKVALSFRRAGFKTIRIGLESSSDNFNRMTGGKTSRDFFLRAVGFLREVGFTQEQIGAYLLVGIPKQTCAQIEQDVEFTLNAGAHPKLAEYSPIPGTYMWDEAVRQSSYPIEHETLFHNCTLLPAALPEINSEFLSRTRRRIRDAINRSNN